MKKISTLRKPENAHQFIDFLIIISTLLITNRRSWLCVFENNKPLFYCEYGTWLDETVILIMIVALITLLLLSKNEFVKFIFGWKKQWLLICFLVLGVFSYLWSVNLLGTTQRVLQLTLTTYIAAYLGYRYSIESLLDILFWFFTAVTFVSFILVAILPGAAIMSTYPHEGFWRGAFSHRNYLGSIVALGNVIALIRLLSVKNCIYKKVVAIIVYAGTIILIGFSGSATGLILLISLNVLFLIFAGWLYFWNRLKLSAKLGILGTSIALGVLTLLNIERLFNLIGRSTTLTGRIPLWKYLIGFVQSHNLYLGFGLGTVWTFYSFREQSAKDLGWIFQIINGHSGYIDTLLYLGIIGLAMLLLIIIQTLFKTGKMIIKNRTITSVVPSIIVCYVIISNITISFFFEFETFHWALLVAVLFLDKYEK